MPLDGSGGISEYWRNSSMVVLFSVLRISQSRTSEGTRNAQYHRCCIKCKQADSFCNQLSLG
jgi:hypothetical protein